MVVRTHIRHGHNRTAQTYYEMCYLQARDWESQRYDTTIPDIIMMENEWRAMQTEEIKE